MKFKLLCPGCKAKLQSPFVNLICGECHRKIEMMSGALNLLTEREKTELQELIQLNIDDMVDNGAFSTTRQHDVHVYIDSGYCEKLASELELVQGATIVDVGCGRGHISSFLVGKGFNVLSIDIVEANLAECRNALKVFASADNLPIEDNSVDAVICTDVLEHIIPTTQEKTLEEFYRVLKPGGKLLVSYPGNILPPHTGHYLLNISIFIYRKLFASAYPYMAIGRNYGGDAHINMRFPWSASRAFKKAGFLGAVVPYNNKFLSLPKRLLPLAMLLNLPLIRMFFINNLHGLLTKPK